ncbi:MAG: hypothetical protein DI533_20240 [Cereibacter sphaeroides]|uniref:F5/8 type C domain-containing protein n=1 Tax=Cereibacter sphaeroides TaxID=1063 RepID=A0A2W5TWM7_CERSP|nr:MAG: hypothetical protein DI533_20240 [Cereibacter sphaeroides]
MASSWYDQPNGTTWHYNNAFDGNINTNWAAAGTIPNWIGYDFGKKVEITEIAMRQSSAADQYWSSMAVDFSDNGTTWTEYGVLTGVPKIDGWRTYPEILRPGQPDEGWDQPHRYWRLVTLQWPTSYQGINEIRLMNGVTDLIAANGGSPSADAAQGGYGPERAFDNNTSTGWADNATNVSHWLQWDFGSGNAFAVTDYKLTAWSGLMPTGWKLQFSDDGGDLEERGHPPVAACMGRGRDARILARADHAAAPGLL